MNNYCRAGLILSLADHVWICFDDVLQGPSFSRSQRHTPPRNSIGSSQRRDSIDDGRTGVRFAMPRFKGIHSTH